jgi:hypothetical protein
MIEAAAAHNTTPCVQTTGLHYIIEDIIAANASMTLLAPTGELPPTSPAAANCACP